MYDYRVSTGAAIYLADLTDLADLEPAHVAADFGGKAAGLARLIAAGARVPPGFALSRAAFDGAVAGAGIELPGEVPSPAGAVPAELSRAANAVTAGPPAPLAAEIEARARPLGGQLIARSSATAEDTAGLAAAGIFASYSELEPAEVSGAVARIWASAFAPAGLAYLRARGVGPAGIGMGVVVQRMVRARHAGVAYSRSGPARQAEDPGGKRARPRRSTAASAADAPRETAAFPADDALDALIEVAPADAPTWARAGPSADAFELGPSCPLSPEQVLAIARAAGAAEAALGALDSGADIEWCIGDDGLWIVQARPIARGPMPDAARPPPEVLGPLVAAGPDLEWEWDAAHNPEPLSPAQIGLVERVNALGTLPSRLAVAGGYLYVAPAPVPPKAKCPTADIPDEPVAKLFRDRIEPAADLALAPAEAGGAALSTCLAAYDQVAELYFGELTPAVSAARRALPELLAALGFADPEGLAGELVLGASGAGLDKLLGVAGGAAPSPSAAARQLSPLSPAWDVAAPTFGEMPDFASARAAELGSARARRRRDELCAVAIVFSGQIAAFNKIKSVIYYLESET